MVKKLTDSAIKVKVFSEEKLCLDRLYSNLDNESWINVGRTNRCIDFNDFDEKYVFLLNITISIIKLESMIMVSEKLYNDTDFTDFRLRSGEVSVAVHKAILAANSERFKTMLTQEWKETAEGQVEGITISQETLEHFKRYMYFRTLPDDGLLPLISIASRYSMESLKKECVSKLTITVKPQEFFDVLESSVENKLPELTFALIHETPKCIVEVAQKLNAEKNVHHDHESKEE